MSIAAVRGHGVILTDLMQIKDVLNEIGHKLDKGSAIKATLAAF